MGTRVLDLADLSWRFRTWWRSRQRLLLLQGLPALLAGGLVITVIGLLARQADAEMASHYLAKARASAKSRDYADALTCYERLAYLDPDRPDARYGLAVTAEALGQVHRAASLMEDLAPEDRQGYAPAHLWKARRLLKAPGPAARTSKAAETHLLRALDGELEDREEAQGLLGELYLRTNRLDQAELQFTKAVKGKPQLRLRLAQVFALRGDRERARLEAEQAAGFFRAWTAADLKEHQARLGWADAVIFLEDFPTAIAVLEEGLRTSGEPLYRKALARAYQFWSAALARNPDADPGEQLKLLEKALEVDPAHMDLIMQLWAFTKVKGEAADKARSVLRAQLASGKASGLVHLALGMDAWEQGKQAEALVHLEQAYRLSPRLGIVVNNLAWVLANSQPPDLERALTLINTVLREWPDDPRCRDTRGQILARKGQWKEALTDFQAALKVLAHEPALHRRLAEAYAKVGLQNMAAEHERQAERLNTDRQPSSGTPSR